MNSRLKIRLKSAFAAPLVVALFCALFYFSALYPEKIPEGLVNKAPLILPLLFLTCATMGIWIGEFLPNSSIEEKRHLPIIVAAYLLPLIIMLSIWKRVFGLPTDEFTRDAGVYGISLLSLIICFMVQAKMKRINK